MSHTEHAEQAFNDFISNINKHRYPELYNYLECPTDASPSTIKEQYRKLSLVCHPDRGGSNEKMIQINEAYIILSDIEKRKLYDIFGSSSLTNWFSFYSRISSTLKEFLPSFLNSSISYFLDLKNLAIKYSTDSDDDFKKLSFLLILGFPLSHHIVESTISKFLNRVEDNKEQSGGETFFKNFISEILATVVASPFEIIAYLKFTKRVSLGDNSQPLYKSYFSALKNWKLVLVLIGFRISSNILFSFLSNYSIYFDEKSRQHYYHFEDRVSRKTFNIHNELNEKLLELNRISQVEEEESESESESEDESQRENQREMEIQRITQEVQKGYDEESMKINRDYLNCRTISKLLGIAANILPSLISVHRLFYKVENPSIPYFSLSLLKAASIDSISHFLFKYSLETIQNISISAQYSIFNAFEYIRNITSNNNNNNSNNTN
ncbi:hypothetical protein DICPUDRAFT_57437 [Dictyostelium purpureum]|uniref:J domain-containing protein n=1 Tax=Dictyostelium purpureum TaxID=5786 RepID=F0ZVX0_DICPU|nr:uncharacterized protein DICPUDRAFT_57437 [Dictyostelium purpureum]EGC31906.1 hypothetical protein DICPUDRAFT_57437 [Dictyostelium purpureum]|eukprot:XP_003291576.1 hypothetical protein DICPUDRAFT_57437 [Dictyostelium purpureum]